MLETSTIEPGLLALNGSSIGANSTGGFFVDADNEEGKQSNDSQHLISEKKALEKRAFVFAGDKGFNWACGLETKTSPQTSERSARSRE